MLLIGWDAADWKVIRPLLDTGQMPNLARLIAKGLHGNLSTIYPVLSPMLWTSIATGKRAWKHGIHGFSEPLPDGSGVRPISVLARTTKAVWNILNQTGHRSLVVGWWPSHPAEPLNGVMVSNHFPPPPVAAGSLPPMPAGAIHPAALAASLAELRVSPAELSGEFLSLFVPDYKRVDQSKDKRLHSLARIIAETMSIHAAATELLETQPWDFAAIYYAGLDHFQHAFMRYHPPRLPWVSEQDFVLYQHAVTNAYRYHDAMLGALLNLAGKDTAVILMSDHGFHPDHLRPGYIPAEPAGPAVEHRHFGILCMRGPQLRANEQLFGASLLDICPTILTLFGLPPARDMDGKVLVTAFKEMPAVEPIESWDSVAGDAGTHPPETTLDPVASAEAFKQLVDLGYVAPPAENVQATVAECVRELKYNLARAYRDGNCSGEAAVLAEKLWSRWPKEHRFGILLVECLGGLRKTARRREVIEELGRRIEGFQAEAAAELATLGSNRTKPDPADVPCPSEAANQNDSPPAEANQPIRAQFEERQLRELAYGRPLLMEWFLLSQALMEKRPAEARRCLQKLTEAGNASKGLDQCVAGALAELGDLDAARALLEEALEVDPENALVHAQLAGIHFKGGRFEETIAAASQSLSLLYFQPGVHALLGQALMETKRFPQAEQELQVAVAQSPRHLVAHESLAQLYRVHPNRSADAFAQEGRARSLRHELTAQEHPSASGPALAAQIIVPRPTTVEPGFASAVDRIRNQPPPFGIEVQPEQVITVVSGLPRSGTSMMMQLLAAAGRPVLTDGKRAPDEDNALGYLEFEPARELATDASWVPRARGGVVKIVAQLLAFLPPGEHYNVIFMERNLAEVIASQSAMLARQSRGGAELETAQLLETYTAQLRRARSQLARRPEIRVLTVNYAELLADPAAGVDQIAFFLGGAFNRAAAEAVRPRLRRQEI